MRCDAERRATQKKGGRNASERTGMPAECGGRRGRAAPHRIASPPPKSSPIKPSPAQHRASPSQAVRWALACVRAWQKSSSSLSECPRTTGPRRNVSVGLGAPSPPTLPGQTERTGRQASRKVDLRLPRAPSGAALRSAPRLASPRRSSDAEGLFRAPPLATPPAPTALTADALFACGFASQTALCAFISPVCKPG